MTNNIRWGLDNPNLFSQMKTELIWGDNKLVMASPLRDFKGKIHMKG